MFTKTSKTWGQIFKTSRDIHCCLQVSRQSGESLGHPGILPWCPLTHRPLPMLSGGSLGHPGILPWCPLTHRPPCCPDDSLDIPGSSFHVPSDTGPHGVWRILGHSGILPWCPLRHRHPWWNFSGVYVTTQISPQH